MISYTIKAPIWNTESIGIASKRVQADTVMELSISYKDRGGQLVYPFRYYMRTEKMRSYPVQLVGGVKLHIIPIEDFEARDE